MSKSLSEIIIVQYKIEQSNLRTFGIVPKLDGGTITELPFHLQPLDAKNEKNL